MRYLSFPATAILILAFFAPTTSGAASMRGQLTESASHTVKPGETFASIARQRGISLGELLKANRSANPNSLKSGQRVVVPVGKKERNAKITKAPVKRVAQDTERPTKIVKSGRSTTTINTTPPAKPTTYTVQPGDTLNKLKRRHNISVSEIARLNNLPADAALRTGQTLRLRGETETSRSLEIPSASKTSKNGIPPRTGSTTIPSRPVSVSHTVKAKESFMAISRRYNVSVSQLSSANHGVDPARIRTGQKLTIPALHSAPSPDTELPPQPTAAEPEPMVREDGRILARQPDPLAFGEGSPRYTKAFNRPARTGYLVEKGENLTQLSQRFGTTATELRRLNRMDQGTEVYPGRYIIVPFYTRPASPARFGFNDV